MLDNLLCDRYIYVYIDIYILIQFVAVYWNLKLIDYE